jgi:hypothetical protein
VEIQHLTFFLRVRSQPQVTSPYRPHERTAGIAAGGNIDNAYMMTIENTILGGGSAATGPDVDNTGTITSGDYNIVQTTVAGNAFSGGTHDLTADPLLLALTNNGGPTFTNAEQSHSPGRKYIPYSAPNCGNAANITTDQRGYLRGASGFCDVGAYEYDGVASAVRTHPRITRGGHHAHRRQHQAITRL